MLSDAIKLLSTRFEAEPGSDSEWLLLTLRVFELEARNMEERLFVLTGLPHVALDGQLIAAPEYRIEKGVRHA